MDRCPEPFELEGFFETPSTAAYGLENGWYYDRLRFVRTLGTECVVCEVEPVERAFSLMHSVGGHVQLDLSLQFVCSLELQSSAGTELLIGRVSQGGVEQLFKLSLKPHFSFQLGTGLPSFS